MRRKNVQKKARVVFLPKDVWFGERYEIQVLDADGDWLMHRAYQFQNGEYGGRNMLLYLIIPDLAYLQKMGYDIDILPIEK